VLLKTNHIDAILGGHTHTFMKEPAVYLNKDGQNVPVMTPQKGSKQKENRSLHFFTIYYLDDWDIYSSASVSFNIIRDLVKKYKIGGLLFAEGTPEEQAILTNIAQKNSKVPVMITFDGEWGLSMRLEGTPYFPKNAALGCIEDNHLIYEYGREVAREFRELGVHVNFAPDADVNTNPLNPVIHVRSFGEDPKKVAEKVVAYSRGLESGGVLSVCKHFPGHGDTDVDSHKGLPSLYYNRERLDSVELYPFKEMIRAGLGGVMVGHLQVPVLEPDAITASSLSGNVVTGLLKNEMGFQGLVFTDALDMKGVSSVPQVTTKALLAGNDMVLISAMKMLSLPSTTLNSAIGVSPTGVNGNTPK